MAKSTTNTIADKKIDISDHVAIMGKSDEALVEAAVPYVLDGMQRNNLVLCLYGPLEKQVFQHLHYTMEKWLEPERGLGGQLVVEPASKYWGVLGNFDAMRAANCIDSVVQKGFYNGYFGLVMLVGMSWALALASRPAKIFLYERLQNEILCPTYLCTSVCLYREDLFHPLLLEGLSVKHSQIIQPCQYETEVKMRRSYQH